MDVFRDEAMILFGCDAHTLEQYQSLVFELLILFEQREIVQAKALQFGVVFVIFAANCKHRGRILFFQALANMLMNHVDSEHCLTITNRESRRHFSRMRL